MAIIVHVMSNDVDIYKMRKRTHRNIYPMGNISPTLICFKIFSNSLRRMLISQRNFLYLKVLNIMKTSIMLFPGKPPQNNFYSGSESTSVIVASAVCEKNIGAPYVLQVNSYKKVVPFIVFDTID